MEGNNWIYGNRYIVKYAGVFVAFFIHLSLFFDLPGWHFEIVLVLYQSNNHEGYRLNETTTSPKETQHATNRVYVHRDTLYFSGMCVMCEYCNISHRHWWFNCLCMACIGLTHWGRVMHICVSKLFIIGWDNGLSPGRRQAIISTNAWILLIGPLGTNFSEILIKIYISSFKKTHLKITSAKCRSSCLGLNVLMCN